MQTKTRVVGSGFTTFNYRGQPIAFLDGFNDLGQAPVGRATPVHPLHAKHPVEIATSRALTAGTLTISIRELWNAPVWHQLVGLGGVNNLIDAYEAIAADPARITCQMIIKPPGSTTWRGKTYHNCVITDIPNSETVTLEEMTISRALTLMYTHTTPIVQPAGR